MLQKWSRIIVFALATVSCPLCAGPKAGRFAAQSESGISTAADLKLGIHAEGLPETMMDSLREVLAQGYQIRSAYIGADPGYMIIFGTNGWRSAGMPPGLLQKLQETHDQYNSMSINDVSVSPDGGWAFLFGDNGYSSNGVPTGFLDIAKKLNGQHANIARAKLGEKGGWAVVYDAYGYSVDSGPPGLVNKLKELNGQHESIKDVAVTGNGGWVVVFSGNGYSYDNIPRNMAAALGDMNSRKVEIESLAIGPTGSWLIVEKPQGSVVLSSQNDQPAPSTSFAPAPPVTAGVADERYQADIKRQEEEISKLDEEDSERRNKIEQLHSDLKFAKDKYGRAVSAAEDMERQAHTGVLAADMIAQFGVNKFRSDAEKAQREIDDLKSQLESLGEEVASAQEKRNIRSQASPPQGGDAIQQTLNQQMTGLNQAAQDAQRQRQQAANQWRGATAAPMGRNAGSASRGTGCSAVNNLVNVNAKWRTGFGSLDHEVVLSITNNSGFPVSVWFRFHKHGIFDSGSGVGVDLNPGQTQAGEYAGLWDAGDDSDAVQYMAYRKDSTDSQGNTCIALPW